MNILFTLSFCLIVGCAPTEDEGVATPTLITDTSADSGNSDAIGQESNEVEGIREQKKAVDTRTAADFIGTQDPFSQNVKSIFDSRCVACHSCYNSPCQLKLSNYDGVIRGGSKINIYDFPKTEPRDPTRLFVDAHSEGGWRNKGFYSVTEPSLDGISILESFITLKKGVESGEQEEYKAEESRVCVDDKSSMEDFRDENPAGRMPYGLPKLTQEQTHKIKGWIKDGAKGPDLIVSESKILENSGLLVNIAEWEKLLNGDGVQAKLSSRYIYEHLFLANIYFETHPNLFFRLVRSRTAQGNIDEMGTDLPFDAPEDAFHYRLRPVVETLTHKSHIPYPFSEAKLLKWKKDFYKSTWPSVPAVMPAYGVMGANPFKTFAAIPAATRYQFLLDEAGYHVMTFIKGPVCRGQTALNVINDHFWVAFVDPAHDPSVNSAETLDAIAKFMDFPAQAQEDPDLFLEYRDNYWKALKIKYAAIQASGDGPSKKWLWKGEGENTNALLTVFRHFDSAQVVRGIKGQVPKTVWVLDYQVLETIYYNLTAGYNVFGPIAHQVNSRLFMEMSRIAAEDLFITFMPQSNREDLRASWNKPVPEERLSGFDKLIGLWSNPNEKMQEEFSYLGMSVPSKVLEVSTGTAKENKPKVLQSLLTGYKVELFQREDSLYGSDAIKSESQPAEKNPLLVQLANLTQGGVSDMPDTTLLLYRKDGEEQIFTIINNKAHLNVSRLLLEEERRQRSEDTLTVLSGVASSYPNLFLNLDEVLLSEFVSALGKAQGKEAVDKVLKKYGTPRSSETFWQEYETFSKNAVDLLSNESGWLDLNRYLNLK